MQAKQFKTFGLIAGGLAVAFIIMMAVRSVNNTSNLKSGMFYKKDIKTVVDSLSDKQLWVEKSTNEIEDIRDHNKKLEDHNSRLQRQLDSIQKLVIGLGVHLHAFDDSALEDISGKGDKNHDDVPISSSVDEGGQTQGDKSTDNLSLDKLENFVTQKGLNNPSRHADGTEGSETDINSAPLYQENIREPNAKILRNGIKIIKFNNADNEYDLDENFIFAGTYARAVLVGSVTVSAGVGASSNPKPVLLRINDTGNLPSNIKGFFKDAMVIGAAYGNLSSESVVIRLERIVKLDKNNRIGVDIPVKGYVAGENGDSEIRGIVIDRAGAVARNAAVAGFMSGMAEYITANNSSAVQFEPNSGLAQFSPQKGSKMLEQGASKGIGNAVEKYADFIIKRAEQMQPVIKIDGGRKLTIVFTESVKASAVHMKKVRAALVGSSMKRGIRKYF